MTSPLAPQEPRDWHVSTVGSDAAAGTAEAPLRTIQAAADFALPGDTIRIHSGTYRERVDPPRGGTSGDKRITFCPAGDGVVEIKGSEVLRGWRPVGNGVWTARVGNQVFGDFNPYREEIRGHWFKAQGRTHHPGAVYLDGHWLQEAASRHDLENAPEDAMLWFAESVEDATIFYARFGGKIPSDSLVEIAVRQSVFYPSREGRNFITVRGLALLHAATPWSPPTTEQIGLIGCHWSKGWIIEQCRVSYSACAGITLGKYNDPEDCPDQPTVEATEGEDTYHGTIRRAIAHGWSLDSIGGHVIRHNTISHCEMAGICGSLGATGSIIEGNIIHDIHVHCLFAGWEQAGIKFHGAIDTQIRRNTIFRCHRGIWLDWMSQGTRVSDNVCHSNGPEPDFFSEVNHGPLTVDGNLFLSPYSLFSMSDGGAYLGNVFLGRVVSKSDKKRLTPYFKPHSTEIVGWQNIELGDDRFFHNVFCASGGTTDYDGAVNPVIFSKNIYLNDAKPAKLDTDAIHAEHPELKVEATGKKVFVSGLKMRPMSPIYGSHLGRAAVTGQSYGDPDGSDPIIIAQFPYFER